MSKRREFLKRTLGAIGLIGIAPAVVSAEPENQVIVDRTYRPKPTSLNEHIVEAIEITTLNFQTFNIRVNHLGDLKATDLLLEDETESVYYIVRIKKNDSIIIVKPFNQSTPPPASLRFLRFRSFHNESNA